MKTTLFLIVLSFWLTYEVNGQPCQQSTITDSTQRKVLSRYISESVKKHYFVDDKGVVTITRFRNEDGQPSWLIETVIDDSYKDNPPVEWASFGRDIILFYDAKTSRYDVVRHMPTPELLQCLNEAIGDRLYLRPPKKERLMEVPGINGKIRKVNSRRIYGGNTSNGQVIIFEKDGNVKVLQSV